MGLQERAIIDTVLVGMVAVLTVAASVAWTRWWRRRWQAERPSETGNVSMESFNERKDREAKSETQGGRTAPESKALETAAAN